MIRVIDYVEGQDILPKIQALVEEALHELLRRGSEISHFGYKFV